MVWPLLRPRESQKCWLEGTSILYGFLLEAGLPAVLDQISLGSCLAEGLKTYKGRDSTPGQMRSRQEQYCLALSAFRK